MLKNKSLNYNIKANSYVNCFKILKNLKRDQKGIKRICLHENLSAKLHFMILDLKKNFFYPRHAHTDSVEIVFVIKGKLNILIWNKGLNKKYKKIVLNSKSKFCLIPKNIFHKTWSLTSSCIYAEIKNGPFSKQKLVLG